MRKTVIGLSFFLIFSLIPAYSASPPKTGTVCAKQDAAGRIWAGSTVVNFAPDQAGCLDSTRIANES